MSRVRIATIHEHVKLKRTAVHHTVAAKVLCFGWDEGSTLLKYQGSRYLEAYRQIISGTSENVPTTAIKFCLNFSILQVAYWFKCMTSTLP